MLVWIGLKIYHLYKSMTKIFEASIFTIPTHLRNTPRLFPWNTITNCKRYQWLESMLEHGNFGDIHQTLAWLYFQYDQSKRSEKEPSFFQSVLNYIQSIGSSSLTDLQAPKTRPSIIINWHWVYTKVMKRKFLSFKIWQRKKNYAKGSYQRSFDYYQKRISDQKSSPFSSPLSKPLFSLMLAKQPAAVVNTRLQKNGFNVHSPFTKLGRKDEASNTLEYLALNFQSQGNFDKSTETYRVLLEEIKRKRRQRNQINLGISLFLKKNSAILSVP